MPLSSCSYSGCPGPPDGHSITVKTTLFAITKSKDANPSREKLQRSFQQGRQDQQCSVSTLEAIVSTIIILLMICTNIHNLASTASLCQRLRRVTALNAEDIGQRKPTNTIVYYHQLDHPGRRSANQKETTSSALWVVGERRPISDAPKFDPNQIFDAPSSPHRRLHFLDLPKMFQVWKPAPTAHTQDLSTHQSISSTTVLASLLGASSGNLKQTMMGAAGRQQHVFRCLGNQICDSPPHQHPHFFFLLILSQVWKPAPTAHTQDLSMHQSISSTTVLASLVGASSGNLKKNDDGCSETTAARVSVSRQPALRQPPTPPPFSSLPPRKNCLSE